MSDRLPLYLSVLLFALVIAGCAELDPDELTAIEPEPAPPAELAPPSTAPELLPAPADVPGFEFLACDVATWSAPGGGDDQCEAQIGGPFACCMATEAGGACLRGVRFHGGCFALEEPPPGETCPADDNANGLCAFQGVIYHAIGG